MAHKIALDEKRSRVVIITLKTKKEDIEHLQPELRAYIQTNIYLQWGEDRFFDKLCAAIAHPKYFETKCQTKHIEHV